MSMPLVRIRDLKSGQTFVPPATMSVEILDAQGNVALLLLPDLTQNGIKLVTSQEEPDVAREYEKAHNIAFSTVRAPDLSRLQSG